MASEDTQKSFESSERTAVREFLKDARRVENYATCCGYLNDDKFLLALEAAHRAEKDGGLAIDSDEYRTLRSEFNKVIRSIYPVTLLDLREWNPFQSRRRTRDIPLPTRVLQGTKKWLTNLTIAVAALVLFVLTGFYTVWAQRTELLISEIQALEKQDLVELERTYLAWLIGRLETNTTQDTQWNSSWSEGSSYFDKILAFEEKVEKLRLDVQRAEQETYPLQKMLARVGDYTCFEQRPADAASGGSADGPPRPHRVYRAQWLKIFCPQTTTATPYFQAGTTVSAQVSPNGDMTPQALLDYFAVMRQTFRSVSDTVDLGGYRASSASQSAKTPAPAPISFYAGSGIDFSAPLRPDQCEDEVKKILVSISDMLTVQGAGTARAASSLQNPEILFDITLRTKLIQFIRCARKQEPLSPFHWLGSGKSFKIDNTYQLQREYRVVSKWWLPSLYGALGAMVYTLGFMLSRTIPDPKFFRSVVRLMMGSLAGVAVVNFFTPEVANMIYVPFKSIGLLALAFLAGFSIEVVLALLRSIINRWSERVSTVGSGAH